MNTTSCRLDFGQMCNVIISNSTRQSMGSDFIDPVNKWRVVVDSDASMVELVRNILGFSDLKNGWQRFFLTSVGKGVEEAIALGEKDLEMRFLSTPSRITKVKITGDLELLWIWRFLR